jgi:hypothetical protein
MISEQDFDDIRDVDADLAFVRLERKLRTAFYDEAQSGQSQSNWEFMVRDYLNHAIGVAGALAINEFSGWNVDQHSTEDLRKTFEKYQRDVDRFALTVHIKRVRAGVSEPQLGTTEKRLIRHYVESIKQEIEESNFDAEKRDKLLKALNAFLAELDTTRKFREVFGEVVIYFAHIVGDSAVAMEPAWKYFKLIGGVLGAKIEDEQAKLPKSQERRQLPPPSKESITDHE